MVFVGVTVGVGVKVFVGVMVGVEVGVKVTVGVSFINLTDKPKSLKKYCMLAKFAVLARLHNQEFSESY